MRAWKSRERSRDPGGTGRAGRGGGPGLNHATLPGAGGLEYPADAYEVTGQLSLLAARLPQALAQILAFLGEQAAAGAITVVAGQHAGNPAAMLTAVTADLDAAVASARRLHQALDGAQNHLTWAAGTGR